MSLPDCIIFKGHIAKSGYGRKRSKIPPYKFHNAQRTLKESQIKEIIKLSKKGIFQRQIGRLFKIDQGQISRIINKKAWKHVIV